MTLKVVTWNLRRAKQNSQVWNLISEMNADILLLQEVSSIPSMINESYTVVSKPARSKNGKFQKFSTAILAKGIELQSTQLASSIEWISNELKFFDGNILSCKVNINGYGNVNLVSIYSPAWPVPVERLLENDIVAVKLTQNKNIYCTELLWSGLQNHVINNSEPWIIGGDFNSSVTFDYMWSGGPRGNQEIIDRMNSIGLHECLFEHNQKLVPTFRNAKGGKIIHQMDHVYVTKDLLSKVSAVYVGDEALIFHNRLSDHLPIITEFEI